MKHLNRTRVVGAFAVSAVAVMVSNAAFACTVYKGQLTASGNGTGNVPQTVIGDGAGMNWCPYPGGADTANWTVRVPTAASVSMDTGPTTACGSHQLPLTLLARVGLVNGFMPQGGGTASVHNCVGSTAQQVDTGTVDAFGVFRSNTTLTSVVNYSVNGPSGTWHSLCIMDANSVNAIAINIYKV